MLKHLLFSVLLGIMALLGYVAWHVGYFKPVEVSLLEEARTFRLVGQIHEGPYHHIVGKIQEVETWAADNNISCSKSFGLYLDNPAEVEQERLRSFGGCLLESSDKVIAPELLLPKMEIHQWGGTQLVQAYFEGSPGIGPFKVYPKATQFMQGRQLTPASSVLEVYHILEDGKAMQTHYYFVVEGFETSLQ